MRAETGRAVLAATGHLSDGGPPLSSLVGRLAAGRSLTLAGAAAGTSEKASMSRPFPALLPAPGDARRAGQLVTSHAAVRQLAHGGPGSPAGASRPAAVVLLAAHGGAGVSSLLRAGLSAAGAGDGQRRWPAAGRVLLVARTSTGGLERARDLARQHASGHPGPHVEMVGLVLVADAPGRLPARIGALADLVCGAFARCWQVPWLTEWRLAAATEPLPVHPEVYRLTAHLHALNADLTGIGPTQADPIRPASSLGALL